MLIRGVALILVALATLGGCDNANTPDSSTSPTPTTSGASPIDGEFAATFTKEILRQAGMPEAELCARGGTYQYTYLESRWAFLRAGLPDCGRDSSSASGTFTISADTVTFVDNGPPPGCSAESKYRFRIAGQQLRFTVVEDACAVRRIILTAQPWARG